MPVSARRSRDTTRLVQAEHRPRSSLKVTELVHAAELVAAGRQSNWLRTDERASECPFPPATAED